MTIFEITMIVVVTIFITVYAMIMYCRFVDWINHKKRVKALRKGKVIMIIEI